EVAGVGGARLGGLPRGGELLLGELANRLQHRKPSAPRGVIGDQQRLANQSIEYVESREVIVRAGDGLSAGEVEPSCEHRTTVEYRPFTIVKQVVGPLHRVTQCLMAFQPAARTDEKTRSEEH